MRKCQLNLLVILLLLSFSTFAQGIYTVNNTVGLTADFNNLQDAINSVPDNSILLLHGSANSYGDIEVRKPLSIIGTGYFIGNNAAPYTQANLATAKIDKLNLDAGSAGTLVSGLTLTNRLTIDSTANIIFSRNYIAISSSANINRSSNISIIQNYTNSYFLLDYASVTFSNNIFANSVYNDVSNNSNAVFTNNIFDRSNNSYNVLSITLGGTANFSNNILINSYTGTAAAKTICGNCGTALVANNNVSSDSTFRGSNNAIINQPVETIFSLYNSSSASQDSRYTLTTGSPAIGAGVGGIDAGIFAGSNPYVLSGIPFIPHIYGLEVPNIGTTGNGLKVRVKAQTNN